MNHISPPQIDAGETFAVCISKVRNAVAKRSLKSIRSVIESAAVDYYQKASQNQLHRIRKTANVGPVSGTELVKTYDQRMAKTRAPGRKIYDQIKMLPDNNRCPFCGHRDIETLDHVLPKGQYPVFAVTPINLVACCSDCNRFKQSTFPESERHAILHPYFDDVTTALWLNASVVKASPAAVIFAVSYVPDWSANTNARIAYQFDLLKLGELYSNQAAREIVNIRQNLQRHFDAGQAKAVKLELQYQWKSRSAVMVNSWESATYRALAESEWFCSGGFART